VPLLKQFVDHNPRIDTGNLPTEAPNLLNQMPSLDGEYIPELDWEVSQQRLIEVLLSGVDTDLVVE
jgi:hypothetical protein